MDSIVLVGTVGPMVRGPFQSRAGLVLDTDTMTALSRDQFRQLFAEVCTWGRFGADGAVELLSPERVATACRLVHSGVTVSLGLPLDTEAGPANPRPAEHRMTLLHSVDIGAGAVRFAKDSIGVDFHNDGHSHIDALCHVAYEGRLYGGRSTDAVTQNGAGVDSITVLRNGLVGRGVLLDIARTRGVAWLEPGEHVHVGDLEEAERDQGVRVETGDLLLVRTGHARRLADRPAWDTTRAKAGLHPSAARFLSERGVAALGSDGNSDTAPNTTEGVDFPMHVLAVTAMGLHLLDYLQFEDLVLECERTGRWEFLLVVAPLRIDGGTGSPVNPIAIF